MRNEKHTVHCAECGNETTRALPTSEACNVCGVLDWIAGTHAGHRSWPEELRLDRSKYAPDILLGFDGCGCAIGHALATLGYKPKPYRADFDVMRDYGLLDNAVVCRIASVVGASDDIHNKTGAELEACEARLVSALDKLGTKVMFTGRYTWEN